LQLIWQALDLGTRSRSGLVELDQQTQLQLTLNVDQLELAHPETAIPEESVSLGPDLAHSFDLLRSLESNPDSAVHRFSVTQLINYQRCPRQYYFDRVLHVPTADQMAVWNDAEAPEPPANLTATLKGAVIHRFCETYSTKDDLEALLRQSFDEVVRRRQAQLADRVVEINVEEAIAELMPLAQNYLSSTVFERVERARLSELPASAGGSGKLPAFAGGSSEPRALAGGSSRPGGEVGLWSELSFRLRRPLGILTGAIDKLLITPSADGKGLDVEIIDFKTNRLRGRTTASTSSLGPRASRPPSDQDAPVIDAGAKMRARRPRSQYAVEQIAFDFNIPVATSKESPISELTIEDQIRIAASDYQLQMQAYALAVGELMPSLSPPGSSIKCTLHFLEPAMEIRIDSQLLSYDACTRAIDEAMMSIVSSVAPGEFPFRPAAHCRMCSFLGICPAGREWVRSARTGGPERLTGELPGDQSKAVKAGR